MLSGLRLRGMRSLRDTGRLEFRPITLLLGQNSSGKSTFLRSLPMLRQSINTRTNAPVLWYGDLVDFGSFTEVLSSFAEDKSINIDFYFKKLKIHNPYYTAAVDGNSFDNVNLSISLVEKDDVTRLQGLSIAVCDDIVKLRVDRKGQMAEVLVNGLDISEYVARDMARISNKDLIPQILPHADRNRLSPFTGFLRPLALTNDAIYNFFSHHFDRRVSEKTIRTVVRRFVYADERDFREKLISARFGLKSWDILRTTLPYFSGSRGVDHLRALYLVGILPELLYTASSAVSSSLRNLAYVGPSRATGERYYRHQELAIDQIDPQGQNLAMFLYSLDISQRAAFSNWLEEEIGYSLQVGRKGGHIQIELKERGGAHFHNLADMGYGFSQILPVMAQIWGREVRSQGRVRGSPFVAIEQPELHLHPAYQSRLADVFASSVKRRSDHASPPVFVVETHSEALVNRLGELVYGGVLDKEDVVIYLFHRLTDTDSTEVSMSTFDDDGILQDWPLGFFSSRAAE